MTVLTVHKDYPCHPKNYRKGRKQAVKYLVIHYVGATGDARNNAKYYSTTANIGASAHYFVGHAPRPKVWASVPEGDTAWHCGAKKYIHPDCRNENSIGVELCCHQDAKGNWYFDPETVDAAVELCRDIVGRYGIDKDHVLRHYDVTGKVCPAPFVRDWTAWDDFKTRLFEKEDKDMGTNVCWAAIPKKDINAIRIVLGNGKSAAQIKAETGCDYVINGGLYNMSTGKPLCHLKSDGEVWATTSDGYIGYGWVAGGDIREMAIPEEGAQLDSYIACCQLLGRYMGEGSKPHYPDEMGGKRGRTAMALTADSLILFCSKDGSEYAQTPEELQLEMQWRGATSAVMLDGGDSSQCDFGSLGAVTSSRRVHHYICVWTGKHIMGRYEVVTKASPLTIRKSNSTGSGKVGSYPKGTVVDVLAVKGNWARTVKGWCSMTFLRKVSGPKPAPMPETVPEPTPTPTVPEAADEWASVAWKRAYAVGVLDGTRPKEAITRQEVAVILDRIGALGALGLAMLGGEA